MFGYFKNKSITMHGKVNVKLMYLKVGPQKHPIQ
jgi:hypothetical protein